MISSTLSSEQRSPASTASRSEADRRWRRWIVIFCSAFFGVGALLYTLLLLIDPYESDRFPNFGLVGVDDHNPRTAHVSRARDPQFNAAVFGNSTGQLIDPHRLSSGTGLSFTQLTVPATGPREQFALMHWFLANHRQPRALVIVTDPTWCSSDPNLPLEWPFPFWLYGSDAKYLANVFNSKSLDRAGWRLQVALGQRPRNDPVGYFDYTEVSKNAVVGASPPGPPVLTQAESLAPFPWIEQLRGLVGGLPPDTAVVLVMPPVYHTMLAPPGSFTATWMTRCKDDLSSVVAGRARSGFVDFHKDVPEVHEANNFADRIHYRKPLAQEEEARIIDTIRHSSIASR